jgi:predicted nucleic acid-binding protein
MIHLDTNILIGFVNGKTATQQMLRNWLQRGETFAISAVAWSEFLAGPLDSRRLGLVQVLIEDRIISFGRQEAELAAELFNRTGRKHNSQPDCFIAATAICAGASFATENRRDFQPLVAAGLRLL